MQLNIRYDFAKSMNKIDEIFNIWAREHQHLLTDKFVFFEDWEKGRIALIIDEQEIMKLFPNKIGG